MWVEDIRLGPLGNHGKRWFVGIKLGDHQKAGFLGGFFSSIHSMRFGHNVQYSNFERDIGHSREIPRSYFKTSFQVYNKDWLRGTWSLHDP